MKLLHTSPATLNLLLISATLLCFLLSLCTGSADVSVGNAPADMTLEEVRAALAEISRKGYTAEIRGLLQKYGTDRLSELNPAHYRALLVEAEELAHAT